MAGRLAAGLTACGLLIVLFPPQPAAAEQIIGRWCDRMVPNMPKYNHTMTIVKRDDGKFELRSEFGDGSSSKSVLRKEGANSFAKVSSVSGDSYRIKDGTGELQLFDKDGPIRVAKRLGNTPRAGDCE